MQLSGSERVGMEIEMDPFEKNMDPRAPRKCAGRRSEDLVSGDAVGSVRMKSWALLPSIPDVLH